MQTEGVPQEVVRAIQLCVRIAYFRNKKLKTFKILYY